MPKKYRRPKPRPSPGVKAVIRGLAILPYVATVPYVGRWLSRDPLPHAENLIGPNLYEYVDNDPLRYTDPLGLDATAALGSCPCGQHPEFNWEDMNKVREKLLLGESVPAAGAAAKGTATLAKDAVKATAERIEPPLTLYELGVDIAAYGAGWHCVSDDMYTPGGTHFHYYNGMW